MSPAVKREPRSVWSWCERKNFISVHSFTLYVTLFMTWEAFRWAAEYAMRTSATNALQDAAIIGAVTAPISYLQKAVFEIYSKSRQLNGGSDA